MLCSLRKFTKDEVAQQRMRIIDFYKKYGEQATKEAFGADRKVVSRWKRRLKTLAVSFTVWLPNQLDQNRLGYQ